MNVKNKNIKYEMMFTYEDINVEKCLTILLLMNICLIEKCRFRVMFIVVMSFCEFD